MTLLRTLLGSIGNDRAVANARQAHDRVRHEDELIAVLVRHVGHPADEAHATAA